MATPVFNIFKCIFLLLSIITILCSCKRDKPDASDKVVRNCSCPMEDLIDSSITREKDSTNLFTDFYDWKVGGKLSVEIKKLIDTEINTSNRSSKSKYEVSTREVVNKVVNNFPDLTNERFAFKINRITFCTYHALICSDTTLADSIYIQLVTKKLGEFEKEFKIAYQNDSFTKSVDSQANQTEINNNKEINATIYTENQSGGTNTVHITTSVDYKEPSSGLIENVQNQLISLKKKYLIGPNAWIRIEVESGSSYRQKVARDLDRLLTFSGNDWAIFDHANTSIGRFPDHPISVFYHPDLEMMIIDLLECIKGYISGSFELRPIENNSREYITIYINGVPVFTESGEVKID